MLRITALLLIFPLLAAFTPDTSTPDKTALPVKKGSLHRLKRAVNATLKKEKGTFAVAFKDLATGQELLINGDQNFHAASTMKTPVLVEAFRQAAAGKFSLKDSLEVHTSFMSIADGTPFKIDSGSDSDSDLYKLEGKKAEVYELLYRMITRSSNLATNMIIEFLGAANVTRTMNEMGAHGVNVLRGVEDGKAYEKGLNNTTTARGLMVLYSAIAGGEAVSKTASDSMINILLQQEFNEIIPARLPATVKVAHKTGFISGVQHDSGIVFLPNGRRYVLVLLSKDLKDEKSAVKAMAAVSEEIYQYMTATDEGKGF